MCTCVCPATILVIIECDLMSKHHIQSNMCTQSGTSLYIQFVMLSNECVISEYFMLMISSLEILNNLLACQKLLECAKEHLCVDDKQLRSR